MNRTRKIQTRFRLAAAGIVAVGFSLAGWIYFFLAEEQEDLFVYEIEHSKPYRRSIEAVGGKLNVVFTDLIESFNGLWHGRNLAVSILCISVALAITLYHLG